VLQERRSKLAKVRTMMSSVDDETSDAVTAPCVGADLCAARERLGWSLRDVASYLRIRQPYLKAIEEGRVADLPGNSAYAVGFVRTYAQSLGLDPREIARRFRAETADINRKTELTFPAPVPERGVPAGAVVLVGAVLAIGAYVGWYHMSGNGQRGPEPVKAVPTRLAPLAEPPAPPAPPAPVAAAEAPATAPTPAVSPSSAAAVAIPGPVAVTTPTVASTPPPAAAPGPDGGRIVLRARADAWVQVRDRQGSVLLNRVMRAGETWAVPGKGQLLLTTGNAGGTELLVDGTATASLGGDGAVRRDLPLDPDLIRDGKLAQSTQLGAARPAVTLKQP
jgi:cytoskeleton protein RodZ